MIVSLCLCSIEELFFELAQDYSKEEDPPEVGKDKLIFDFRNISQKSGGGDGQGGHFTPGFLFLIVFRLKKVAVSQCYNQHLKKK